MSARLVTVQDVINKLKTYPPDMYVATECRWFTIEHSYEGYYDGPDMREWRVIPIKDVRSGFNPMLFHPGDDPDWDVLVIG